MNKSEIYHLAQIAVINTPAISPENKLRVLKVLFDDENLAAWQEQQATKEGETE